MEAARVELLALCEEQPGRWSWGSAGTRWAQVRFETESQMSGARCAVFRMRLASADARGALYWRGGHFRIVRCEAVSPVLTDVWTAEDVLFACTALSPTLGTVKTPPFEVAMQEKAAFPAALFADGEEYVDGPPRQVRYRWRMAAPKEIVLAEGDLVRGDCVGACVVRGADLLGEYHNEYRLDRLADV